MGRMRKLTVLGGRVRQFRGAVAEGWGGETGRRQRLVGMPDAGGKRRHLFGVGEGPTEAVAEAKQETIVVDNGSTAAGVRNKGSVDLV